MRERYKPGSGSVVIKGVTLGPEATALCSN